MKVSCLIGSPRPKSNSAAIAARFTETAASLGATIETTVLNDLTYKGCQGCMACKISSEKCVVQDELAPVLEGLKGADVVVLALPVYCSDVPGQVKCFIDRTYSYMPPNFMQGAPSRVPPGKKLVYILTQGAPVEEMFADVAKRYPEFLKRSMAFGETHVIRGIGVGSGGAFGVPDPLLQQAEDLARKIVK
jgi:multimeric flavodoxin WrbA